MDYRKELARVERMIRNGRIWQLFLPAIHLVLLLPMGEGGFAIAFFVCPALFYLGYASFSSYEEILYDENAPRPNAFIRWVRPSSPKNGRRVLKEMKAYREELLKRIGGEESLSDADCNTSARGFIENL